MALDGGGGLTFSLDVASEGAASLRTTIMKKLSEFMGSYTDDVLAEYVVVLVGHGKHRTQAVKDLEAFLGDQSEAFVTWLWDHLGSNIHLYTSATNNSAVDTDPLEPVEQEESKMSMKNVGNSAKIKATSHEKIGSGSSEGGRLITLKKDNENKSKKELENDPIGTTKADSSGLTRGRGSYTRQVKRPRSPDSSVQTEKTVSEKPKRQLSPPRVSATRRLLQSAVREAVAPTASHPKRQVRDTSSTVSHSHRSGSSVKRLQSVVSADVENTDNCNSQQITEDVRRPSAGRQGKRAVPAIMMAMKAAAAAAEDVSKARGRLSGNIWERLGKKSSEYTDEHPTRYSHEDSDALETSQDEVDDHDLKRLRLENDDYHGQGLMEDDALASGFVYDEYTEQSTANRSMYVAKSGKHMDEQYEEDFSSDENIEESEHVLSKDANKHDREESVTVEYRVAAKESQKQKGLNASSGLPNASQKIVNISVNTWKNGAYDKINDSGGSEQLSIFPTSNQSQEQMQIAPSNELDEANSVDMKQSWESLPEAKNTGSQQPKEAQKTSAAAITTGSKQVRKPDDAESRTVFVTNIHFAASKESVMAHFASCGEIGRIVMITDGATGQSKGSAYIEFKTKEATDRALALNESTFYSRALKVVRKDAAIQAMQEMSSLIHPAFIRRPLPLSLRLPLRGRFLRGSPFLVQRRFPAMPRPYGNFPSLQWKRDTSTAPLPAVVNPLVSNGNRPNFNPPVRPPRSLSYVRPGVPAAKAGEEGLTVAQSEKDDIKSEPTHEPKVDSMVDVEMEQA